MENRQNKRFRWGLVAFFALHVLAAAAFFAEPGWQVLAFASALYLSRMFAITAFYHRYFSHRTFKTSRSFQFLMAAAACTAAQRGPLWWSGHHRHHHAHSDTPKDVHSPRCRGILWSHVLWFMPTSNDAVRWQLVRDWSRYPELLWLEKFNFVPPLLLAMASFLFGELLAWRIPASHASGWQFLTCGFALSTVVLYHATYCINSVAHLFGSRRFDTPDDSRNNAVLAIVTLGEGWHNNHHRYPTCVRQGLAWWEIDVAYYVLKAMSWIGLVWGLRDAVAMRCREALRSDSRSLAVAPATSVAGAAPAAPFAPDPGATNSLAVHGDSHGRPLVPKVQLSHVMEYGNACVNSPVAGQVSK